MACMQWRVVSNSNAHDESNTSTSGHSPAIPEGVPSPKGIMYQHQTAAGYFPNTPFDSESAKPQTQKKAFALAYGGAPPAAYNGLAAVVQESNAPTMSPRGPAFGPRD